MNMKVMATINHSIDKILLVIVEEFGHNPIIDEQPVIDDEVQKII